MVAARHARRVAGTTPVWGTLACGGIARSRDERCDQRDRGVAQGPARHRASGAGRLSHHHRRPRFALDRDAAGRPRGATRGGAAARDARARLEPGSPCWSRRSSSPAPIRPGPRHRARLVPRVCVRWSSCEGVRAGRSSWFRPPTVRPTPRGRWPTRSTRRARSSRHRPWLRRRRAAAGEYRGDGAIYLESIIAAPRPVRTRSAGSRSAD